MVPVFSFLFLLTGERKEIIFWKSSCKENHFGSKSWIGWRETHHITAVDVGSAALWFYCHGIAMGVRHAGGITPIHKIISQLISSKNMLLLCTTVA